MTTPPHDSADRTEIVEGLLRDPDSAPLHDIPGSGFSKTDVLQDVAAAVARGEAPFLVLLVIHGRLPRDQARLFIHECIQFSGIEDIRSRLPEEVVQDYDAWYADHPHPVGEHAR